MGRGDSRNSPKIRRRRRQRKWKARIARRRERARAERAQQKPTAVPPREKKG